MKKLLLHLVSLVVSCSAAKNYRGYRVYRAQPDKEYHLEFLQQLQENKNFTYDFWTEVRGTGQTVDIMVSPSTANTLETELAGRDIRFEVMIPDVQKLMVMEAAVAEHRAAPNPHHSMTWDAYHPLKDMYSYLDYLEKHYDYVTTEVIGKSFKGRKMRLAKVCRGGCGHKPAVWIDGGMHAREWITPATVTWMLKEIVENNAAHSDMTKQVDWYILPCFNPDGYAYTHTSDRMWRKTRSHYPSSGRCKGVDPNRNWGFHFAEGGSSNNPCSDRYHGPKAFSEIENVNVRDYLAARKDKLIMYNNIHSYSQMIMLPWAWTGTTRPNDYNWMYQIARKGARALKRAHGKHGKRYKVGCIPCLLYVASGGSTDWAKGINGVKFSMGMELRDTGLHGFCLPPKYIVPTGEEVWAFHLAVVRELLKN